MSTNSKQLKITLFLLIAAGAMAGGWWFFSTPVQGQSTTPKDKPEQRVKVQSEVAVKRDLPEVLSVTGFVTPLKTVDIRSQVVATVQSVNVLEGQTVRAGQSIFSLDERGARADSEKLAAQLVKDQVAIDEAQRMLARNTELFAKNFVSKSIVDTSNSVVEAAQAALKADRAALASGQVAVDYRRLTAPIAGRVGEIKVHVGSLVQPGGVDALTTISQMDPINVTFSIPERYVRSLLAEQRAGTVSVTVQVGDEKLAGKLSFIDNAIDATVGGIKARAVFDNPQMILWPGALVDVSLTLKTITGAIVISPRAVQVGPSGQFVYVIGEDEKVTAQPVKIEYLATGGAAVSGLKEGSRVVTEGGQNLRPGLKIAEAKVAPSSEKAAPREAAQ